MNTKNTQSPFSREWARCLDSVFSRCEGAYSHLTLAGYRKDLELFADWCRSNNRSFLPAEPVSVADFFDAQLEHCSYATIKRRASAIKFVHVASDLPCPMKRSEVFLALRRAARMKRRRPKQVRGLTRDLLTKIVAACPKNLAGSRDAALISLGYDTLCRSSELSWMRVEDLHLTESRIYIPRSKSDPFGDGRFAGFRTTTKTLLSSWLAHSRIHEGPLFRGLHTKAVSESHLDTSSIRRIVKSSARRAGLVEEAIQLSGHSMRVGAAQDLLKDGFDTIAIMTAGGWKTPEVVARYVESTWSY